MRHKMFKVVEEEKDRYLFSSKKKTPTGTVTRGDGKRMEKEGVSYNSEKKQRAAAHALACFHCKKSFKKKKKAFPSNRRGKLKRRLNTIQKK
jgi:hypothetical protein